MYLPLSFPLPFYPFYLPLSRFPYVLLELLLCVTGSTTNQMEADSPVFPPSQELNASTLDTTISFLQSNTEYMIQVRMEVCYSACFSYLPGNYSELILASTNAISEKVYAAVSLTFRRSCLTLEIITLSIMG